MNRILARAHPGFDQLLGWWLHETDAAATAAIDEHLMHCDACGAALDQLAALGAGVRQALAAGLVAVALPPAFIDRLGAGGLRIREYHLPPGGSVNCTVAPDDDLLVARLEAPLAGVQRLDARIDSSVDPAAPQRLEDIPFDAPTGRVILLPSISHIRSLPAHRQTVTLIAVEAHGERDLGRYRFEHQPWAGPD